MYVVKRENGTGKKKTLHRNLLLPIDVLPRNDDEKRTTAPVQKKTEQKQQRRPPVQKTTTKPESIDNTDEGNSDEESEQSYYIYPVRITPSRTDRDATMVKEPAEMRNDVPINDTGDDFDAVGRRQVIGARDALPSEDQTDEVPTPGIEEDVEESATDQQREDESSDEETGSALTDPSLDDMVEPIVAPEQQDRTATPRTRRRILPTPPRHVDEVQHQRPQRNRQPPKHLIKDYVCPTIKQATTSSSWERKIQYLERQAANGMFKGLEIELSRTILKIVEQNF